MPVVKKQWPLILLLLIASLCHFVVESKIFERCELAKLLHKRHHLNLAEVAQWVCIAQHSSGFNTAAQANSPTGGSHGIFQVSDVYWCSPPGKGGGCNVSCQRLRDDDLSDDLSCIKRIYDEHQRISGDGYTAWNAYQQYCQHEAASYIQDCFSVKQKGSTKKRGRFSGNAIEDYSSKKTGKVYERCELARELYNKHQMSMKQIPTWICIVEHESRFNTAAVGRLNADSSADHGIFQISDLYWCSHDRYTGGGKACGLSCSKLLDNDITDDVQCVKRIHTEHTALSGDGFNAWTVYRPYCQNQHFEKIANCFKNTKQTDRKAEIYGLEEASNQIQTTIKLGGPYQKNPFLKYSPPIYNDIFKTRTYASPASRGVSQKGKVYTRCSLAQELYFKHNFPIQDISTWLCIAEHESQFNTAAIGQLNTDGSSDYGIFQINDRYWCDHSAYGGKGCNLSCNKLLDENLEDDVACIKMIHEEHNRLSGDGFNAWTVYKRHCQNQVIEDIQICFDENTFDSFETYQPSPSINVEVIQSPGKIYNKCELAQELYRKHHFPMEQIHTWVCIAQHESSLNTAAIGRLNGDGSADHGLFQISDLYWCSHDQHGGKACNIPCHKLLDSDISDDVECIKIIHEEHTRISGDGFNAWTVYQPHCHTIGIEHTKECFTDDDFKSLGNTRPSSNRNSLIPVSSLGSKPAQKGKVYKKCELAQELYRKHHMPMDQIPKWVCIAQYESSLNTAAIGRLNTDGSADHGLFQISDLYWCSHDQYGGKACNIPCHKLLDSDISDDVECIKIIHEEHTRISGDGFNAWTVYQPNCRKTDVSHIKDCFTETELKEANVRNISIPINSIESAIHTSSTKNKVNGKIYKKCELAQELLSKHRMPMEQVSTWVCIAEHESSFNTAAVGRLNMDGSLDHGLFQISDLYWCSHDQYGGKACNMPCDNLLDSDITDDVECIKIIYEEHTRISGDGFSAWTLYKPHCRNRKIEEIRKCFSPNQIEESEKQHVHPKKGRKLHLQPDQQIVSYSKNPFLNGFKEPQSAATLKTLNSNDFTLNSSKKESDYFTNPFLKNLKINNGTGDVHKRKPQASNILNNKNQPNNQQNNFKKSSSHTENYQNNPFLSGLLKSSSSTKQNYKNNPFLNRATSSMATNEIKPKTSELISTANTFVNNIFLMKPVQSANLTNPSFLEKHKMYLNSNEFRITTTSKPITTTASTFITTKNTKKQTKTTKKSVTSSTEKPTGEGSTTTQTISKTLSAPTTKKTFSNTLNTKTSKSTTAWSWLNQNSTTKPPTTDSTWKWENKKYYSTTTRKPPRSATTKQAQSNQAKPIKTSTTQQIQKQNYTDNNISAAEGQTSNISRTTTVKQQKTTTTNTSSTENWRKWDKTTTKTPTNTISNTTTRSSKFINEQTSTTTENWRKWDKTTTTKPSHKTTKINQTTAALRNDTKSTTSRPLTSPENWRKWDKTTTKTPNQAISKPNGGISNSKNQPTTKHPTSTENWRKWDKTTTKPPNQATSKPNGGISNSKNQPTTKHPTSTENMRKWNKTTTKIPTQTSSKPNERTINLKNYQNPTATKPLATTEKWKKLEKTTTKNPTHTTKNRNESTSRLINKQKSTSIRPLTSTENLRQSNKTSTTKPSHKTTKTNRTTSNSKDERKSTTIMPPLTSTENLRQSNKTSTTKPSHKTTKTNRSTSNSKHERKSTTTMPPPTSTVNWRKRDSSTTSTTRNWATTTTINPTIATTTKITTTKPIRSDNYKKSTTTIQTLNNYYETTTLKPVINTTKSISHKNAATTTTMKPLTTKSFPTNTERNNYKRDPFSHPFFAKVNEQLRQLYGNNTTTKLIT